MTTSTQMTTTMVTATEAAQDDMVDLHSVRVAVLQWRTDDSEHASL